MSFKSGTTGIALLAAMALTGQEVNANWGLGWCDPFGPAPVETLDVPRYVGNWYEIRRDKDAYGQRASACATATYEYNQEQWWNPWPVAVYNRQYDSSKDEVTTGTWGGLPLAGVRCTWGNGNCDVKFLWLPEFNYKVLATDYDSYALVYNC